MSTVFRTGPPGMGWTDQHLAEAQAWAKAAAERGVLTWVTLARARRRAAGNRGRGTARPGRRGAEGQPRARALEGRGRALAAVRPVGARACLRHGESARPEPRFPHDLRPAQHRRHRPRSAEPAGPSAVQRRHGHTRDERLSRLRRPPPRGTRTPKLHMVGLRLAALRRATGRNTVTMTLQICFSGSQNKEGTEFILPTRHQERYMIYDAIVNGARGLNFFGGEQPRCQRRARSRARLELDVLAEDAPEPPRARSAPAARSTRPSCARRRP